MDKKEFEINLKVAKEMIQVQGSDGNWNYNPYMYGLYNGMEYILAIFENREPEFRNAPKTWLCDKHIKSDPSGEEVENG